VGRRLAQAEVIEPFRTARLTKDSNVVQISMTATALVNESGDVYAVCTTERELATAPSTAANATEGEATYARPRSALE
jgi:hypothetical protein